MREKRFDAHKSQVLITNKSMMIKLNLDNCYLHLCSEQQLVDCSTSNYGCNGGWQDAALYDVSIQGGIAGTTSYPYTSGGGTVNHFV